MKKLVFSVFAATLAFGAGAENVETATAPKTCSGYDGFYLGLGIAAIDGGVKTETTYAYDSYVDNNVKITSRSPAQEGIDSNDHDTKFTGTFTLGFGKVIKEKAYVALEAQLDAGANSNFYHPGVASTESRIYEVRSRTNGLVPSIGLKLGYVHPATKGMIYLKAGAAYTQSKTYYEELIRSIKSDASGFWKDEITYQGKCAKWTPMIAIGGEKLCGKNLRARFEAEYRFGVNKKFDYRAETFSDGNPSGDTGNINFAPYGGTIKLSTKDAITLRAMAVYTIRK